MKDYQEVLNRVEETINEWQKYPDTTDGDGVKEKLIVLRGCLYYLTGQQVIAHQRWHAVRNDIEGSEVFKDREADMLVDELYMFKHKIKSASDVAATMAQQLKILTEEKKNSN